jgi:hypothetical protein
MISVSKLRALLVHYLAVIRRQDARFWAIGIVSLASIGLCIVNAPHSFFVDEHDNILGAQALTRGDVLYKDYFSHHMPLTYFVTLPLYALTGNSLITLKILFGLGCAVWILIMSRHIYRQYGLAAWSAFTLVFAGSTSLTYANMILAETLVALAATHIFIIFALRQRIPFSLRTVAAYSILAAIPVLSSASYLWISLIGYTLGVLHGFKWLFSVPRSRILTRLAMSAAIVALPFTILLGYLAASGSIHYFKEQAFDFNTQYYSQFISDISGSGFLVTLINQIYNVFASLYDTIFNASSKGILPLLLVLTLIAVFAISITTKATRLTTIAAIALLFAAGIRSGFGAAFEGLALGAGARFGTVIACVSIAIIVILYTQIKQNKAILPHSKQRLSLIVGIAAIAISLSALTLTTTSMKAYSQRADMIMHTQPPDAPSTVINLVNTQPTDRYWVGPLDFYNQLFITSQNASSYRFYLPWHAVCPTCTATLIQDFASNKPKVVYWNGEIDIWGHLAKDYGQEVQKYLDKHYYQVSDTRLNHYYFLPQSHDTINEVLVEAGYKL